MVVVFHGDESHDLQSDKKAPTKQIQVYSIMTVETIKYSSLLLMKEILHLLIGCLSHYLPGFSFSKPTKI